MKSLSVTMSQMKALLIVIVSCDAVQFAVQGGSNF